MTIENLKAGLEILMREGVTGQCVRADSCVIDVLLPATGIAATISIGAKEALEALGWGFDPETDSWAAFT